MKKRFATLTATAWMLATLGTALAANAEKGLLAPTIATQTRSAYCIVVDGKQVDAVPAVMVPVRSVAEAMGFTVTWASENGAVTLDSGTMHTTLTMGQNTYLASTSRKDAVGTTAPFSLSAAPFVSNGTTYAPIELFTVLMGNDPKAITVNGNTISVQTKTTAQIPNPLTEHATLEELKAAVGFPFQLPTVPEGYQVSLYQDISGTLAEVRFSHDSDTLCYRVSSGSEDNSGDWTAYSEKNLVSVNGVSVTCKGENGLVNLATWTNHGFSYSLSSETGLSPQRMQDMVKSLCV